MNLKEVAVTYKEESLHGRYITLDDLEPLLESRRERVSVFGYSAEGRQLYDYKIGNGPIKVLMWSQMHGNEATATRALFDLFKFLESDTKAVPVLEKISFCFVPMLNPDGALRYTRENANGVDLNRDFVALSQPESRALTQLFEEFQPDYCFNLHDQRSIFGVGESGEPATMSFLAPAFDSERNFSPGRERAVGIIMAMVRHLQEIIPGKIGRFDDSFNPACVGDNFQMRGTPTILVESGHYPGDYDREICRNLTFQALLSGIFEVYENVIVGNPIEEYLIIPQNMTSFFDFGFRNVKINYDGKELITNFVAQYKEELIENKLFFNAYFADSSNCENYFTHQTFDAKGGAFLRNGSAFPVVGESADFSIGDQVFLNARPI